MRTKPRSFLDVDLYLLRKKQNEVPSEHNKIRIKHNHLSYKQRNNQNIKIK